MLYETTSRLGWCHFFTPAINEADAVESKGPIIACKTAAFKEVLFGKCMQEYLERGHRFIRVWNVLTFSLSFGVVLFVLTIRAFTLAFGISSL